MALPSPSSFAVFALVNAIVWPGFALAYWFTYQREEERLLDAIGRDASDGSSDAEVHKKDSNVRGDA